MNSNFFSKAILLLIILSYLSVVVVLLSREHDRLVVASYKQGVMDTKLDLANKPIELSKKDKENIALSWWVGSDDKRVVRKRLCGK